MARLLAALLAVTVSAGLIGWAARGLPFAPSPQVLPHLANLQQPFLVEQEGTALHLLVEEVELSIAPGSGAEPLPATIVGRTAPLGEADDVRMSGGFRHQWPAVYATARFGGDAVIVAFDDPINRYRIELDEGHGPVIQIVEPGARAFRLSGLGPGPHTIRVDKISESASSAGLFEGFYLPAGETALAPPAVKERQIEFIGDSDTVGLGDLSSTRDCEDYDVFLEATDTRQSFGPRVAVHFGADYEVIAASGIHLMPSGGAGSDPAMLELYPRAIPDDAVAVGQDQWEPDLMVILIGSNDLVSERRAWGLWQTEELPAGFQDSYLRFLRDIRARNLGAFILVLTLEDYGPEFVAAHEEIVTARQNEGETRIDLLSMPELERTACNWHPSLADHQRIAEAIIRRIEARADIW